MTEHPVTPPFQLLQLWFEQHDDYNKGIIELLIEAARYGADQELEACCLWVNSVDDDDCFGANLRAARRPKPPSLKEQALEELILIPISPESGVRISALDTIRRALEQLDD